MGRSRVFPFRWTRRFLAGVAAAGLAAVPAAGGPAAERTFSQSTRLYEFTYAYPAAAAAIPALRTRFEAELRTELVKLRGEAREGEAAARENGFPYNPYMRSQRWAVVAALPGWLSLSAELADYTGGAHGNHGFAALLWDKRAGRARAAVDLFVSRAALAAALRTPFCAALDRQRATRRGAPVDRASGDPFDACIDPTEQVLILGSRGKQAFDRIGVLVGPYAAGPYVEGDYEVTLPVTPAVLAAVRPEFRQSFVLAR